MRREHKPTIKDCLWAFALVVVGVVSWWRYPTDTEETADTLEQWPEVVVGPEPVAPPVPRQAIPSTDDKRIFELHNQVRLSVGVDPLVWSDALAKAAGNHAEWMANGGRFGHTGSGGSTPWQRAEGAGYKGFPTGENVASGQKSADSAMRAWINSPGHYANIVSGDSNEMGAAVFVTGRGVFWVVMFGRGGDVAGYQIIQILPQPIRIDE